jgi:hypothetical protein
MINSSIINSATSQNELKIKKNKHRLLSTASLVIYFFNNKQLCQTGQGKPSKVMGDAVKTNRCGIEAVEIETYHQRTPIELHETIFVAQR